MLSDSDLSDAPEDVTFQQSKEETTKIKLVHSRHHRNLKEERKVKHKQREELFSEQKKAKISRLAAARLPDDVIDALPDEDTEESDEARADVVPLQLATRTEFSSDDEQEDDVDSGINSTVTSKISVKEVQAIKSKAFSSALAFKSIKDCGSNENIRRQSAKDRQMIREKNRSRRQR